MNPSYENGGQGNAGGASNIPGVKPGVIASGPATAQSTAPANPGVIASGPDPEEVPPRPITTPSGLNIGSSRQPTGGRPMNMPIMSASAGAPAGGDIAIGGNEASGSNKRGLIIGGVIAGVVALVLVVVLAVVMSGNGGNTGTSGTSDYALYTTYFNYLLNTNDFVAQDDSEFNEYEDYRIQLAYYDQETSYFTELNSLWNNFYTNVTEENKYSETSKIIGDIEYQNELMDFMSKYMAITDYDEESLLQLYIDEGASGAQSEIEKSYNMLATTIYEPGKAFAESSLKRATAILSAVSSYDTAGCIVNDEINYECLTKNASTIEFADQEVLNEVDDGILDETINLLVEFGFRINNDFEGLEG